MSSSETAPSPGNSTSPSPPSDNSTSPSPPADDSSSSPPPPSGDSSDKSPPAPPPDSSSKSPPAPPPSNGSDDSKSPPPPPPPPPPSPSPSSGDSKAAPPPPPKSSSNSPPTKALSPPPPPKSSSSSPSSGSSSSSSSSSGSSSSSDNTNVVIGVAVGVGLFFVLMIVLCCVCSKKKKKKRPEMDYWDTSHGQKVHDYYNSGQHQNWHNSGPPPGSWGGPPPMMNSGDMSSNYSGSRPGQPPLPPPSPMVALGFNSNQFTYDDLAMATGGFNEANLLGQGGFGYVHKGVLPNGKEVAVKSLKSGSGQGEREFQAEVEIISRVHHRHLVTLEGYCIAGGQRMLVYEFVSNQTLEHHLHGKDIPVMDWATRLKIAMGAAKGLAYLHEDCHPRIIHRDIKAANILLDDNFEAMVADFGLAKLSSDTNTHVSTRVMGTFGYLAPEYASSGKLTEKSDVFSFGVMLLELITGKRPVDTTNYMEDSLVDWARPLMADGNYDELVDPRLERNYNPQEMAHMVSAAAASIRHSARKRPKMSQIVRALEGDVLLDDMNEGQKPSPSGMFGSGTSSDFSPHNTDVKKFKMMALNSQEVVSSEYGGSSGDSKEMRRSPH